MAGVVSTGGGVGTAGVGWPGIGSIGGVVSNGGGVGTAGAGAAGGGLVAGGLKHSAADEAVGVLVVPPLGQSVRVAPSAVATAHIKHWQCMQTGMAQVRMGELGLVLYCECGCLVTSCDLGHMQCVLHPESAG
jgi:hypothetical protein